jgi:hypothetical protein
VNTTHDLEATSYAPTSHAPRGDESTVASAWSSSPLGDPSGGAAYSDAPGLVDDHYDLATDLIAPARKPWFISKGVLAGALIAAVGLSAGLGITLLSHSNQAPRPVAATAGATAAPVAAPFASLAPAPAPAPPAPAAPADIPAPAPVAAEIPAPAYIPAPAPIPDVAPPPAAPPPPPAAPPPPPVVVAPVPVFVPHPPVLLPHPLNPAGPSHSIGCLPPHHLFGGVCH